MRKYRDAPSAGRVVRKSTVENVVRGAGDQKLTGGREVKGAAGSGDPAAPAFRKLNNVDAKPRNV